MPDGKSKALLKRSLVKLGGLTPARVLYDLNGIVNYLEVGAFMRQRGFIAEHRVATDRDVFDLIAAEIGDERVLYLEFGVAEGGTTRYWSSLLHNPDSLIHGFDSFEGLPADWTLLHPAGHFSTGGHPPAIADPRVTFYKGWFEDTLPHYSRPPHDVLVVNVDADLYSSVVTVLETVETWLAPGTFLYFDEFNHRADEMRAFSEFLDRTGIRFELYAATYDLAHVAFRRAEVRQADTARDAEVSGQRVAS